MEELSPTDRLATALAQKIEADIVPKPQAAKSGTPTLHISDFVDNRSLLKEAGILHEADVEVYVKALEDHGFETPLLFQGLLGNQEYMTSIINFKHGHAIRLQQFLARFDSNSEKFK